MINLNITILLRTDIINFLTLEFYDISLTNNIDHVTVLISFKMFFQLHIRNRDRISINSITLLHNQ